jgi:hypothetical protein
MISKESVAAEDHRASRVQLRTDMMLLPVSRVGALTSSLQIEPGPFQAEWQPSGDKSDQTTEEGRGVGLLRRTTRRDAAGGKRSLLGTVRPDRDTKL